MIIFTCKSELGQKPEREQMRVKNIKTKEAQGRIAAHFRSDERTLRDAYTSYSREKEKAFESCLSLFNEYGGSDLKIVGHNSSTFAVGFYGTFESKPGFFFITKGYNTFYC